MIEFYPADLSNTTDEEFELYWNYKNELWVLNGDHPYSRDAVRTWYDDILSVDTNVVRVKDEDGKQVGFIFVGFGNNCHIGADFYINDCYMEPDSRRQHLMFNAVCSYISEHPGRYCLFLIDSNSVAFAFWDRVFSELNYVKYPLPDLYEMETETVHLHAFCPGPVR